MNFKNQTNLALVISVLLFLTLSCDAWVKVAGKIWDETGTPVANAKVIVEQGDSKVAEKMSEKDGSFDINENVCPLPGCSTHIKVTISKEGYRTYEKMLSEEDMQGRRLIITLIKNQ